MSIDFPFYLLPSHSDLVAREISSRSDRRRAVAADVCGNVALFIIIWIGWPHHGRLVHLRDRVVGRYISCDIGEPTTAWRP
jgi:hypothetical protein